MGQKRRLSCSMKGVVKLQTAPQHLLTVNQPRLSEDGDRSLRIVSLSDFGCIQELSILSSPYASPFRKPSPLPGAQLVEIQQLPSLWITRVEYCHSRTFLFGLS